jgi:predicted phage terminase large subunit-like protein
MTRGVGSPPTGVGFKRIVIDDPIRRREDAESEVYREKVWDWYTDDLYTRLEPGGAIVLVMTLWHEDDVGARAVASEPGRWTVLKLPALAEEDDQLGRAIGEALWPDRYNVESLTRIHDVMMANEGEYSWNALFQQRPSAREGTFFKVAQFKIVDAAPVATLKCRAWDLAASAGEGDFTVGVLTERAADGRFCVTDVVRGQWDADETRRRILQTAALDGKSVRIHIPQDPGQAGKDQAQQLVRMLAGYQVKAESISGRKEIRAYGYAAQVNAGNYSLVKAPWNKAFIEVHRAFPSGKNDDDVDAGADSFNEIVGGGEVSVMRKGNRY